VLPEVSLSSFFNYYDEVGAINVTKLLIRGSQLYEMREEATKVLKLVIEIEFLMRPR